MLTKFNLILGITNNHPWWSTVSNRHSSAGLSRISWCINGSFGWIWWLWWRVCILFFRYISDYSGWSMFLDTLYSQKDCKFVRFSRYWQFGEHKMRCIKVFQFKLELRFRYKSSFWIWILSFYYKIFTF